MSRIRRRARGQTLVEFALVLPIFLVLMMAVIDIGHVIWARNSLENAAREGARYAIVHGGTLLTTCPSGPDFLGRTCSGQSFGSTAGVTTAAQSWAQGIGSPMTVQTCYGSGCSGNTNAAGATNERGTPVTVRASAQVSLIVPGLFSLFVPGGIGPFRLDSTVTMLVNT